MTRAKWISLAWAVTIALGLAGIMMMALAWEGGESFTPHSLVSLGFGTVGAIILLRRPHRVGALFLGFGMFAAGTGFLLQACAVLEGDGTSTDTVCGDGNRLVSLLWPAGFLFFGSLLLLFPDGKLPSRRWIPSASIFFASWSTAAVSGLLMGDRWIEMHLGWVIPVAVWSLAAMALAPFFRRRRATPVEKQQLRWLSYVIVLTLLLLALGVVLELAGQEALLPFVNLVIFTNAVVGVPVAIAVAILRHRLYDIDVIVNRTLVYVLLTAGSVVVYLFSVVVLQRLLTPLTAESDLAVAASTLAVAALFRPMRARMQTFIDHRFYRRKYDAAETLERFSAHLRDEVELESLKQELVGVVAQAMQPTHASVWLAGEAP